MLDEVRKSTPEEFSQQLSEISSYTQGLLGFSFLPPSIETQEGRMDIAQMNSNDLMGKYSKRMEFFESLTRAQSGDTSLEPEKAAEIQSWLKILNNIDTYIKNHYSSEINRTLYDRQMTVFEDMRDTLEQGILYGSVQLPTGVGKTVLFTELAEATDVKTLILVPTLELLDQTEEKFDFFAPNMEVGKVYKRKKDYGKQVTVMTYASLISQNKNGKIDPKDYDLVILDEEHRSRGEETQEALSQFNNTIKFGFSATPYEFEGRNEIHKMSVVEAVEEGLLADFSVWWVKTDIQLPKLDKDGNYDEEELNKILNIPKRNKAAVDIYTQRFNGTPTFAYCFSVQHAKDLAQMFLDNGINAAAVWGTMDDRERKKILEQFKKGEIKVLCNNKLLREGIDIPSAKLCLRLAPGHSAVNTAQEGGRVLRLYNNETAYIVEFNDKEQKGDQAPLSYAEVVEVANAAKKSSTSNSNGKTSPTLPPKVVDLDLSQYEIITDIEEIMRVIGERKIQRDLLDRSLEGFINIPLSELTEEYNLTYKALGAYIHDLANKHPEYFKKSKLRGEPYVATDEGFNLLMEILKQRKAGQSFIEILPSELRKTYSIGDRQLKNLIRDLSDEFPEAIISRGAGKPYLATTEGMGVILTALEDKLEIIDDMIEIDRAALLEEFSISTAIYTPHLYRLIQEYPDYFKHKEGKPYFTTLEGMNLLRESLQSHTPEGFLRISITDLCREFRLNRKTGNAVFHETIKEYSDLFKKSGGSIPHLGTEEGLKILRDRLKYKSENKWKTK